MNILFINPSLRPESVVKIFPVGLGYIVTAAKIAGIKFDLIDIDAYRYSGKEVEQLIKKKKYDIVLMGAIVTAYKIIKQLSALVKDIHPDAKIICGNTVGNSIVNTILTKTKVDFVIMGEGDITTIELIKAIDNKSSVNNVEGIAYYENEKIVYTKHRQIIKNLDSLPFIDYSIFDIELYIKNSEYLINDPLPIPRDKIRALPINSARGCPYSCTFCYHNFQSMKYRTRSPEMFLQEVKDMIKKYNLNYIIFSDELTFHSKLQANHFLDQIIRSGLNFYWVGTCRGNLLNDEKDIELIEKMKKANCLGISYSLESADPNILEAMNKKMTVDEFNFQTKLFLKSNFPTWTSLVFGYPQETPDTIKHTLDICIQNKIYPSAGYLLPQPGSEIYRYACENKYIKEEEEYLLSIGDRQDLHINLTKMKDMEFVENVENGLKEVNEKLKIGLNPDSLLKTQFYRHNNNKKDDD
jgi:radical SAM superfamily enzyme YgiQ (UPF0313 family)